MVLLASEAERCNAGGQTAEVDHEIKMHELAAPHQVMDDLILMHIFSAAGYQVL